MAYASNICTYLSLSSLSLLSLISVSVSPLSHEESFYARYARTRCTCWVLGGALLVKLAKDALSRPPKRRVVSILYGSAKTTTVDPESMRAGFARRDSAVPVGHSIHTYTAAGTPPCLCPFL